MKAWQKRITSLSLFPFGSKSEPPFAAAHRQRGQRILEDLLEGEELQDAEVDRGMKTQTAFVGADRAVHLDAEPAVHVQLALIVLPGDAEHDHALRLDDPLEDLRLPIFRMLVEDERERLDHFLDGLVKLRFRRVLGLNIGHQRCDVITHWNAWPNAQALDVSVTEAEIESKIYDGPPKARKGAQEISIVRF